MHSDGLPIPIVHRGQRRPSTRRECQLPPLQAPSLKNCPTQLFNHPISFSEGEGEGEGEGGTVSGSTLVVLSSEVLIRWSEVPLHTAIEV
jgi:hypothetical protein